jgi:hemoglobin/transferrin/lactoferrin receptor protein
MRTKGRRRLVLLLLFSALAAAPALGADQKIAGVVTDSSGGVIVRAEVSLATAAQAIVGSARTDERGRFEFTSVRPGRYLLVVVAPGFDESRTSVASGEEAVAITLAPRGLRDEVTVTANLGLVQDPKSAAQTVTLVDAPDIAIRAKEVVAQAVAEETGVHLLRTSPTMAGIYVRGLTGAKVNVFVDGVRYSTSSQRGGVNTFLDLVDATNLQSIEVLRGPNSAEYGSDALGGSVQFLSQMPTFSAGTGKEVHGAYSLLGATADQGWGTNLSLGYGGGRFGLFGNIAFRRVNPLRTGEGIDSHAAPTRFFGVSSDQLMPEHLPDTGFTQYGGLLRASWAPTANQQVMLSYTQSRQDGGKRYDQLLGGDGNLVADLQKMLLNFFYVKYQRTGFGWFDQFTATYSYNSQREERVNQGGNGNPTASITHEYERTVANGFQANASKRLGDRQELLVGGEFYPEIVHAPSYAYNPVTGATTVRRGRVPDNASYMSGGFYVQDVIEAVPNRLNVVANARFSGASYESLASDSPLVNGKPLWPDDSWSGSNFTFRAGVVVMPGVEGLTFTGNVSSGYRSPSITDLGTTGLTGSGYSVSATTVAGMDAMIGTTAGANAVSSGLPVVQLTAETSLSYEGGVHYRRKGISTDFYAFVNNLADNIVYQSLILPQGAVGTPLGDQVISAQTPGGAVYVPASSSPVLVRANYGDARIYGFEYKLDWSPGRAWTLGAVATYLHAADRVTGLPPNIEGGTPAPDGYVKLRYMKPGGAWWAEAYVHLAATQDRLSSLDLEDRRTGATRTRSNIKNFFYNGATVRGWVVPGADGIAGNADDLLTVTGETLSQVQTRVLGPAVSAPLYTSVAGYTTVGLRGGFKVAGRHEVTIDFENIGDRNYRGIAWGIDAPGRNLAVSWRTRF